MASVVPDGNPHRFELRDKHFYLDGQQTTILAGEMHFGRMLSGDFELRVKQAKAMGLNTISFYLFWNQVEPREGVFDFTGANDVRRMLKICQDNGMWVILRPGPYCCAEVEYGGIPYWTLKYPDVKIRTTDPKYVEWSRKYIEEVYKQVGDFQVEKGGPILMVQVENEYGIVANGNFDYVKELYKVFRAAGFGGQLFTCDPGSTGEWNNPDLRIPGVLIGRNGLRSDRDAQATAKANGDLPVFSPETYTGWFSGWGQNVAHRTAIPAQMTLANYFLDHQYSFCLYMFFGGTNWGFYNGCNEYLPVQTSYDYDAPIDEAGRVTERYRQLRELYGRRTGRQLPAIPADPEVTAIPTIKFDEKEPLVEWLAEKPTLTSVKPVSMEDLDQAYGYVLYRKKFADGVNGKLELRQAMDYTIVMVNGKTVGKAFIGYGKESNIIDVNASGPVTLDLLVHNLGRISVPLSSATQGRARKGLIGGAYLDGKELSDWDIYSLPMETAGEFKASSSPHTGPTFYHATFNLDHAASTFLDMRNWSFGAVWVNGHNLGRYWDRGALRTLFLPSEYLKAGENQITILELHDAPKIAEVAGSTKVIESKPTPFVLRLDQKNLPVQAGGVR